MNVDEYMYILSSDFCIRMWFWKMSIIVNFKFVYEGKALSRNQLGS